MDELFAALDLYATGMQIATWGWFASLLILLAAAAWLATAIVRRIAASFTRALQLIHELDLDTAIREEDPQP